MNMQMKLPEYEFRTDFNHRYCLKHDNGVKWIEYVIYYFEL